MMKKGDWHVLTPEEFEEMPPQLRGIIAKATAAMVAMNINKKNNKVGPHFVANEEEKAVIVGLLQEVDAVQIQLRKAVKTLEAQRDVKMQEIKHIDDLIAKYRNF